MNQHNNDIHDASGNGMSPCDQLIPRALCGDCEETFLSYDDAFDHVENSPYCRGPVHEIDLKQGVLPDATDD